MRKILIALCCSLGLAAAFQTPCTAGLRGSPRLQNNAHKFPLAMLSALVGAALAIKFSAAPVSAAALSGEALKKAETVKESIKLLCSAGSTGAIPVADLVVAIIDDGSADVAPAFIGATASGAKAVKIKYNKKEGIKGRLNAQAQYLEDGCTVVITPTADPLYDLMQGTGLECSGCSYGGGTAPPAWFIVMDGKGKTNKELGAIAGVTGWGCFDETLALVPGNVFEQKPKTGKIKKCGPYGIQTPVFALDTIAKLPIKAGAALMSVEGVSYEVSNLPRE